MRSSVDTAPMQMLQSLQLTMRASLYEAAAAAGQCREQPKERQGSG
jgi:hypothetical protein